MHASAVTTAVATVVCCAGAAQAAFDTTLHAVGFDPSTIGTEIASLDIASTSYGFPMQGGTTTSGYVDDGPIPGTFLDKTQLVTRVYTVTQQTSLGGLTLNVGDNIFAYTIRLVQESTNTVQTMSQFQVTGIGGLDDGNGNFSDALQSSFVKGYGFVTGASTGPVAKPTDFSDYGAFGGKLDFEWGDGSANHLDNGQTITLLMFTSPSAIGNGFGNMTGPPVNSTIDPNAEYMPILIPIIPSPGAGAVFGLAAIAGVARRRRRHD